MRKVASSTPLLLTVDASSAEPLFRQIYQGIREGILSGRLRVGERVPSTRLLAGELGVARSTVVLAYEHLVAEGYVTAATSVGSFVADNLPDVSPLPAGVRSITPVPAGPRVVAARVREAERVSLGTPTVRRWPVPFRVGEPALDAFPTAIWETLRRRRARRRPRAMLGYGSHGGFPPLREAIATYLGASRGVRVRAEQVLLVRGAQQAIDLVARTLLDPGCDVWVEDPGYLAVRAAFLTSGARLVPVPVDEEGLDVAVGRALAPHARMAYVAPSNQFPLGVTMSLPRRLALLDWAAHAGAWVVEDDYDSDFRYAGRPITALQGLDTSQRVIYVGTFSKTLFPALRLGYLAVPPDLVDAFDRVQQLADFVSPTVEQAVVADFLSEGHFARHVRRMRALYQERQAALHDTLRRELSGLARADVHESGMHLVAWLDSDADDAAVSRAALDAKVEVPPLSLYCLERRLPPALLMGYAAVPAAQSGRAARLLRGVLERRARARA
jgi:GntR family transcriptional regulator/MocR family aminotransferase